MINFSQKIGLFLFLLINLNFLFARDAYLRDNFPSKDEIFAKIKGNNEKETLIKQAQTFHFLRQEIIFAFENTPKEKQLVVDYDKGLETIYNKYDQNIQSLQDKKNEKAYLNKTYKIDDELKNFVINNLFDKTTRQNYFKERQEFDDRRVKQKQKMEADNAASKARAEYYKEENETKFYDKIFFIFVFIIGLILSANMLILGYFNGKRKKQNNDSYNMMWGKALGEVVVSFISVGLMLLGILLVAGTFHQVFG